jgi:two-component system, sensor histidine kinase and response regulator
MTHTARASILLVDDQPEGLLALEAILCDLGADLVKARSGREALLHVLEQDFAVVLLDVQMPEMDGYEVASLIRGKERCQHTPIIFLTASHMAAEHRMHGYAVGAVDYMFKPIEASILRSKVRVFVELARQQELIRQQAQQLCLAEQEARELATGRAKLIRELEDSNRELETVNRELEAFSYSVSHDLRAPLRIIDGFSQALLEDCGPALDQKGQDHLQRVRRATQRMSELIDDLLKLAHVSRTELQLTQVDLSQLAGSVADDLQRGDPSRRVSFAIDRSMIAESDARLVRVIFENLLGNAWKFTGKTADPRIEVGAEPGPEGTVYTVRDNGAGFEMARAARLFTPFQRLHSQQDFPGTGIGLATVRRIVDRHGGRIWAEGAPEKGAKVSFTLHRAERLLDDSTRGEGVRTLRAPRSHFGD